MIALTGPDGILPLLFDAIPLATIYLLIGISWAIIFRSTGVLNLAIGEFALLACYLLYTLASSLHVSIVIDIIGTLVIMSVFGGAVYLGLFRRLLGRPHWAQVVLSLGLATALDGIMGLKWGSTYYDLPQLISNIQYRPFSGADLSAEDLLFVGISVGYTLILIAVIRFTSLGVRMRAATESPLLASLTGVSTRSVLGIAWALGTVAASLGGLAFAFPNFVGPPITDTIGLLGLAPVLVGGLDSVEGVALGAVIVSIVQTVAAKYLGATAEVPVAWALLLVFLLFRPQGLFGSRAIQRV